MNGQRQIAMVASYDELLGAFRARAADIAVSYSSIDDRAGLAQGYTGKLFGPAQVRKLGTLSLWLLLEALGLSIVLVENPKTLARTKAECSPRDAAQSRPKIILAR
jgi:hypothetical protein